jgi:hypothetical protein
MYTSALAAAAALLLLTACSGETSRPTEIRLTPGRSTVSSAKTTSLTSTWEVPLADASLSVKSDHNFPDANATYSVYANGVCSFTSTFFTTGSGDDTFGFNYPKPRTCGRTWTVSYPDGFTETLAYGGGVQVLQNSVFSIPVGGTALRHFRFGTGGPPSGDPVPGRCSQGLVFGENGNNPAPGSDSVVVVRVDAQTWDVHSQAAPNDKAYCIDNGMLYAMQVSFRIIASQPLP